MDEKTAKTTIYKLNQQLKEASQKYYQSGNSSLEDVAYDALEKQLRELESQYPHLKLPSSPTQKISDAKNPIQFSILSKYACSDSNFKAIAHLGCFASAPNISL